MYIKNIKYITDKIYCFSSKFTNNGKIAINVTLRYIISFII